MGRQLNQKVQLHPRMRPPPCQVELGTYPPSAREALCIVTACAPQREPERLGLLGVLDELYLGALDELDRLGMLSRSLHREREAHARRSVCRCHWHDRSIRAWKDCALRLPCPPPIHSHGVQNLHGYACKRTPLAERRLARPQRSLLLCRTCNSGLSKRPCWTSVCAAQLWSKGQDVSDGRSTPSRCRF